MLQKAALSNEYSAAGEFDPAWQILADEMGVTSRSLKTWSRGSSPIKRSERYHRHGKWAPDAMADQIDTLVTNGLASRMLYVRCAAAGRDREQLVETLTLKST